MKKMLLILLGTVFMMGSFMGTAGAFNKVALDAVLHGEKKCIGFDLKEANLSGVDLSGIDLDGAKLDYADLSGANLSGANLYCTEFPYANLNGANLSGAKMGGALLYNAKMDGNTILPNGKNYVPGERFRVPMM